MSEQMSKHEKEALIILCVARENRFKVLTLKRVAAIAEKVKSELRDAHARDPAAEPVLFWRHVEQYWGATLAWELVAIRPVLYTYHGDDQTDTYKIWRHICHELEVPLEPFPVSVKMPTRGQMTLRWIITAERWPYLNFFVEDELHRAQPRG